MVLSVYLVDDLLYGILQARLGAWLELRGYALVKKVVISVQGRRTITLGQSWHTFLMKINIALTKH
ncbi:hypothetical protein AO069_24450 [Pseudomonas syringae pv. syringae PD2774]|nr:hypothetical protein AO069_24450 [Pseudomonas syringae pv. syringae PD2774]